MKCRLIRHMGCDPCPEFPLGVKPSGTVIDHHQAYLLVQMGVAVPEDQECRMKAGMNGNQMIAAQHAYERVNRGISPEDYEAFDKGIMTGYNPDGSWVPGPNYDDWAWEKKKTESPIIIVEE